MAELTNYEIIRPELQTGDLLQWRGQYPFSKVIRTGTKQFFNHSSFLIRLQEFSDHIYSIEALDNGLFMYRLSTLLKKYQGTIEVFRLDAEYRDCAIAAAAWLLDRQGTEYDWSGCFSNRALLYERLGLDSVEFESADENALFCSESVYMGFAKGPQEWGLEPIDHIQNFDRPPVPGNEMLEWLKLWKWDEDDDGFCRGITIAK